MLIKITFMAILLCQTVSGQTEEFEQECNVLQTLDTLGTRLQKQEALLEEQKTHLEHQDAILAEQATHLEEQKTHLEHQDAILAEQATNLEEQKTHLEHQDAILAEQATHLEEQKTHLEHQDAILAEQATHLEEQKTHLEHQDAILAEQAIHLEEQKTHLEHQDVILAEQATHLEEQKTHLKHQDAILAEQATLLQEQKTRLHEQEAEIATLRQQTSELARGRTSSTYVRWGRTTCPGNGSELVYTGYVGGSRFSHAGAAVDYLCLPTDPHFANYEDGVQNGAFIYGAEYQMPFHQTNQMKFFPDNDPDVSLENKDVPCAVCKATRSTVLMVPARTTCHDGWTLEYSGYMSAGHSNYAAASQYVCLDGKPEYLDGGRSDDNGKLFYLVEARCGSLRCPPYEEGWELTCAVCSI